jgi:hypothetical protein
MDSILKKAMAVFIMLAVFAPALAQEDLPDPGILPTSPVYGVKKGWERALDVITFDPESKSRLHYTYAMTRLAEADALADLGDTDDLDDVIDDYEDEMDLAEDYAEDADPCVPVTCEEGDEDCTPVTCDEEPSEQGNATNRGIGQKVSALVKLIENKREKHLVVLELVAQKVPEQAAEKIQRNIERHLTKMYPDEIEREEARIRVKGWAGTEDGERVFEGGKVKGPKGTPEDGKGKPENGEKGKPDKGKPDKDNSGSDKGNKGGGKGK